MKRVIAVVICAAAAFAGWRYYSASYAPVKTYKDFAEQVLHRQYDAAAAMTEGLSADNLQKAGTQEKIGAGPPMFQTLFPSRFTVESQELAVDGTLTLHAVQTVLFNPQGVESAVRPAMYAKMKQTVHMRRSGAAWKITAFENTFDSMDSMTSR